MKDLFIYYSTCDKCWFVYHKGNLLFKQRKVPSDSCGRRTLALISLKLFYLGLL